MSEKRSHSNEGPTAGAHYAALVANQLEYERAAKQSLEQRGVAVITTGGTMVAVLLSLTAVATANDAVAPPAAAKVVVVIAVLAFVAACAAAVVTNALRLYELPDIEALSDLLEERYSSGPAPIGERRVAELQIKMLERVREQNKRKANALQWALELEVGAVTLVGGAIVMVLASA